MKKLSPILIVITARGGSKGLPGKNLNPLAGKPLLEWTWDAVRAAGLDREICVLSTDNSEIAELGKKIGIPVPFMRPTELATDSASSLSVVLHAIEWLENEKKISAQAVLMLQPTSPFRNPNDLKEAVRVLTENPDLDGVLGVKPVHRTLATLFYADSADEASVSSSSSGRLTPVDPKASGETNRQKLPKMYTPNGSLYLARTEAILRERSMFPKKMRGMCMGSIASIDIDDAQDWAMAEALARTPGFNVPPGCLIL